MVKVPDAPDVKTKKYYEFRGVDFTHDHANVFYRRSPDAVNMRPNESGRPIKRHGWDIAISNDLLLSTYNNYLSPVGTETSIKIYLCKYFTLAGQDHIVIFTDKAVFIYSNDLKVVSVDIDCILSYERTYFFDANGFAAFYIYGGFKVWRYSYNGDFVFESSENFDIYVPTILIGLNADGSGGTTLESYNLLGDMCAEQFYNNLYATDIYRVKLANEVSADDYSKIKVKVTETGQSQFNKTLQVITTGTPAADECKLVTEQNAQGVNESFIEFVSAYGTASSTEDNIRVEHPTVIVTVTAHEITSTATATLDNERG